MKTVACYALHYGKEYLEYSIRSIYDYVDTIAVFYTNQPSYGHRGELTCPEAEGDIWEITKENDPDSKIKFIRGFWPTEGDHRRAYERWAEDNGFECVLVVDYDEVWDGETLEQALQFVSQSPRQRFLVPMIHLWQGFDLVCRDLNQPQRFYKPLGTGTEYVPLKNPVWHFGYAISDKLMTYKWSIHGHQTELRPGWLQDKWLARATEDIHPTNTQGFWNAEPYDKEELPDFMRSHPRWTEKQSSG
jgi:hypothetical protein